MKKSIKKVFQGKYIDMLFALETIMNSAEVFQADLEEDVTTFTLAYFTTLLVRIDDAFGMIGVDKFHDQREATDTIQTDAAEIYDSLSSLKRKLTRLYADDKKALNELFRTLGYAHYYKKADKNRYRGTIELCNHFSRNLSPAIQADLVAKGVPLLTLTTIVNAPNVLRIKNVKQENAKGFKMKLTEDNIITLNALYNEVMTIADAGKDKFRDSRATYTQFSYNAVLRRLRHSRKAQNNDNAPDNSSGAPSSTPQTS